MQKDTGYINSIIIVSAVALNLLNSRLSDKFAGRLKSTIVFFLSLSLGCSVWLALLCFEVISPSKARRIRRREKLFLAPKGYGTILR